MKDEFKPCGYLVVSNMGGIEIEINDAGDAARFRMYNGRVSDWQEIKFDKSGNTYIYVYSTKYFLAEFMKYDN